MSYVQCSAPEHPSIFGEFAPPAAKRQEQTLASARSPDLPAPARAGFRRAPQPPQAAVCVFARCVSRYAPSSGTIATLAAALDALRRHGSETSEQGFKGCRFGPTGDSTHYRAVGRRSPTMDDFTEAERRAFEFGPRMRRLAEERCGSSLPQAHARFASRERVVQHYDDIAAIRPQYRRAFVAAIEAAGRTDTEAEDNLYERLEAVARHEAGHWVIGTALGMHCATITLTLMRGGHIGTSLFIPFPVRSDAVEQYAESRVTMLFAGAVAEHSYAQTCDLLSARQSLETGGSRNDMASARELTVLLAGLRVAANPDDVAPLALSREAERITAELLDRAAALVMEHRQIVDLVAAAVIECFEDLDERLSLGGDAISRIPEVRTWLQMHCPNSLWHNVQIARK